MMIEVECDDDDDHDDPPLSFECVATNGVPAGNPLQVKIMNHEFHYCDEYDYDDCKI